MFSSPKFMHSLCSYPYQIRYVYSPLRIHSSRKILEIVINKMVNNLRVKVYYQITKFSNKISIFG